MSDHPLMWDRLTGQVVPLRDPSVQLGRYQIPEGQRGYSVGTVNAEPGAYLVGAEGRWALRHDGVRWWSGDFGGPPLPAAVIMESVRTISRRLRELETAGASLEQLAAVPPMIDRVADRLRPHPLEKRLHAEFAHLRKVCIAPHTRLRAEDVLVPVSRARSITWRTVTHLAGHSETWAARRLHGVEPAKLLTPVRVPDHDLYENRVIATLVDRLWKHLLTRIAEVDSIDGLVGQARVLLEEIGQRHGHREKQRLYQFVADLLEKDDLQQRIEELRGDLLSLRDAFAPLLTSELRTGVRGPYTGPPQLRPTNLWDNDIDYRHCRRLWQAEIKSRQSAETEPDEALAQWCGDFARYVLLLSLRALRQLGLEGERAPEGGFQYRHAGQVVALEPNGDDTIVLRVGGVPILRIVPLPHALTGATDDNAGLIRALDTLRGGDDEARAVVYPGEAAERTRLPGSLRLRVHTSSGMGSHPAMVPVSPSDLGSVSRMARLLRNAIDGHILLSYPVRVTCRVPQAEILARHFTWIRWEAGQVVVAGLPQEYDLEKLPTKLSNLRTRTDTARRHGDNKQELEKLRTDLSDAIQTVASLAYCPICHRKASERAFTARDGDTYRCSCQCGAVWETRRCLSCSQPYAVLAAPGLAEQVGGDGDRLDMIFSQDLLAAPCWTRSSSYICPSCGSCPERGSEPASRTCERCGDLPRTSDQ
ncbi:hypothetical protein [Actinomadura bangladeshensis]|uniref:DUF2357 domain-containing protein n=1 Tax=Actinomadura bangladeshensis TaxID=453573 RepID=A0A4R4P474_9ACTN|nr:hypothetical protein [Actinomadura bangladeshensis]TDC15510.1 hypothetical protein E1284_15205 [Actinomadura bangladeshensis]